MTIWDRHPSAHAIGGRYTLTGDSSSTTDCSDVVNIESLKE